MKRTASVDAADPAYGNGMTRGGKDDHTHARSLSRRWQNATGRVKARGLTAAGLATAMRDPVH